jgi:Amt family ammonium transporter
LDVFAAHGIGGITGAVLTGVFATTALNAAGQDGLLYGNPGQVVKQVIVVGVVFLYSAILTVVILKIVGAVTGGLRPDADKERKGMDVLAHSEEAYANGEGAILILDEELNGGKA